MQHRIALTAHDVLYAHPYTDSPAIIEAIDAQTARVISRAQLLDATEVFARKLLALGAVRGKDNRPPVLVTSMQNTPEFIAAFFGAKSAGFVVAPLNPNASEAEIEATMLDVRVAAFVTDASETSAGTKVARKLGAKAVYHSKRGYLFDEKNVGAPVTPRHNGDDIALFLHTSGTTAKPKLVPLSHTNMAVSVRNIMATYEFTYLDRTMLIMPLFHIHGIQCSMFATLSSGGTIILPGEGKFSASTFWRDAVQHKATWFTAVPTMHTILLSRSAQDKDLIAKHSLRFVRSCSSALAPATLAHCEATYGVPVLEAYAMTEAAHQVCSNPLPKHGPHKSGSVGLPSNIDLVILLGDKETKRYTVAGAPGTVGEVAIRAANVTVGYVDRPEANAESFVQPVGSQLTYFMTGDLGKLDTDGYLHLVGRNKEMINRGGEKISPVELDALMGTHPDVGEAVAFGLPDEKYGEAVYAAVVAKPGKKLEAEDIRAFVAKNATKDKVPVQVFVVDAIPKTATGKLQRRIVADHFISKRKAKL